MMKHKASIGRLDLNFGLRGDQLIPEFWSAYLGIKADYAAKKGDVVASTRAAQRQAFHIWGVWIFDCKAKSIQSIDEGILSLAKALQFPRADFKQLLAAHGCEAILGIFVDNSNGSNPPLYGKVTQDFIDHTGAELNLDVVNADDDDPE